MISFKELQIDKAGQYDKYKNYLTVWPVVIDTIEYRLVNVPQSADCCEHLQAKTQLHPYFIGIGVGSGGAGGVPHLDRCGITCKVTV